MVPSQWKRIFQPPTRGRVERERKHKPPGNLGQPQPQTVVLNHINYLNINPHLSTILTRFTISTRFTILHQLYIYIHITYINIFMLMIFTIFISRSTNEIPTSSEVQNAIKVLAQLYNSPRISCTLLAPSQKPVVEPVDVTEKMIWLAVSTNPPEKIWVR